jgi:hypothetical protein
MRQRRAGVILWQHVAVDPGRMLASDVPPEFCMCFESIETITAQKLSAGTVQRYVREFAIAPRWHRWRGRAEIAARFEKLSLACEAWLPSN